MPLIALFFILFFTPCGFAGQVYPLNHPPVQTFYEQGKFDPRQISEDDLYASIQAEYSQETDWGKRQQLAERLLRVKWWRLWDANAEMSAETTIFSGSLQEYFRPGQHVQWTEPISNPHYPDRAPERLHYGNPDNSIARHSIEGIFPFILPVNGVLLQEVYFPESVIPESISLKIQTQYMLSGHAERPQFSQVRWTKEPQPHFKTENRPGNFWAGTFPPSPHLFQASRDAGDPSPGTPTSLSAQASKDAGDPKEHTDVKNGEWRVLAVNLVDIGLCGRHRTIHGIEFTASNGQAWFGRTMIRRPQVEIRGKQPYNVFSAGDAPELTLSVHNFLLYPQQYTLDLRIFDYHGSQLQQTSYTFDLPGSASQHETITVNPHKLRYLVFEYTLRRGGVEQRAHGYSSAAILVPNPTGRQPDTKFGMMYWDQPGQEIVEFYKKLGVKLIVIFPEKERLHLFDSHDFEVMPMLWALPERNPKETTSLQHKVSPYLNAQHRHFSNFWETDLRVPPDIFAPNMQKFSQIVKQVAPQALTGIGGLAWFNVAYLSKLFREMKPDSSFFDFLCVMLYNTPSPPEYSGMTEETEALSTILQANHAAGAGIWNVEWSYYDVLNVDGGVWLHSGIPRGYLAPYTLRHHLLGFAAGIETMAPGSIIYSGRTPLAKNYGHSMTLGRNSIFRYDLTPLPMAAAYSVLTRMLEGKAYQGQVEGHPNVICQVYQAQDDRYKVLGSSKTVLVLWSPFGHEEITLTLFHDPSETQRTARILNMIGEEREQRILNGELHLTATPEPAYILLDNDTASLIQPEQMAFSEPFLTASPLEILRSEGENTLVQVIFHLCNPHSQAVRGRLRLSHPSRLEVVKKTIRYETESGEQMAAHILKNSPSTSPTDAVSDEIWLGRHHSVSVIYDVMLPKQVTRNTFYEQAALGRHSEFPIIAEFLMGTPASLLAHTLLPVRTRPPLELTQRPVLPAQDSIHSPQLQIHVKNTSPIHREGRLHLKADGFLTLDPDAMAFSLHPGQSQEYMVNIHGRKGVPWKYEHTVVDTLLQPHQEPVALPAEQPVRLDHYRKEAGYLYSFGIGEGYVLETLAHDQTGYETRQSRGYAFRPAVKTKSPLTIDGDLHDWADAVPFFINPQERLSGLTFFAKDYGGTMQWTGDEDFSGAWQMMWDKQFLYLAVKVYDDQVVRQHQLGSFWNGDSLSFQIDPLPDHTDSSMIADPADLRGIHTFNLGFSQDGPILYRKYPARSHQPGIVKTSWLACKQVEDGLIYELALPWEELSPLKPEAGGWIGFSLVIYEDDGDGRETRINWFGGTGGNGLAREPRLMGDVHFVE